MISLAETGLLNAVLAVVLALPVLILGRIWHRPALVHAFWILVLLKLVSPPLYQIPISWSTAAEHPTQSVSVANGATAASASAAHSAGASAAGLLDLVSRQLMVCLQFAQSLAWPGIYVWVLGSVCWFGWQGWRIVRFTQVFLKYSRLGPPSLQKKALVLARQMGLSDCPEVWLLPAVVSPMLWSVGGKTRILFPRELLGRLDHTSVATLLTHELAHYRRGDHRVRLLEFLASGVFWWHPLVWIARREIEVTEEQCCDAWVVSQFPDAQRQYADALLETVDFLSREHPAVPAIACGLGEVPMLRQRLKLIMCGTGPKSLSKLGRAAVIATALLIPGSPSIRQPETIAEVQPQATRQHRLIRPEPVAPQSAVIEVPQHGESHELPTGRQTEKFLAELQNWQAFLKTVSLKVGVDDEHKLAFVKITTNGRFLIGAEWNGSVFTWMLSSRVLIS